MGYRVDYSFSGRLDSVKRSPSGGVIAKARLTRTGIFVYSDSRGRPYRELRPAAEVLHEDSLATLRGAPLTNLHPSDPVTPENWKALAVGHVGDDVRADGKFVAATVYIQDAAMCAAAERGDRVELSCGYSVELDETPGRTDAGESYDAIQRTVRYNHVALGPKNWGRAGPEVRLHLDGGAQVKAGIPSEVFDSAADSDSVAAVSGQLTSEVQAGSAGAYAPDMTVERTDAPKPAPAPEAQARIDSLTAQVDALTARADAAEAALAKAQADLTEAKKGLSQDALDAAVAKRCTLLDSARSVMGKAEDFAGKSDRDVILAALSASDPKFVADGKSDEYLRARFDFAVEASARSTQALTNLGQASGNPTPREDGPLAKALAKQAEEQRKASQAGAPEGSFTRKAN